MKRMLPILAEIITLAACLAPKKAPKTFTSKTLLKSSFSNSKIPDSMISSFPYFGYIYIYIWPCPRPFRHQIHLLHHNGCKRWIQSQCLCKLSGQARLGYLLLGPLHHVKQKALQWSYLCHSHHRLLMLPYLLICKEKEIRKLKLISLNS